MKRTIIRTLRSILAPVRSRTGALRFSSAATITLVCAALLLSSWIAITLYRRVSAEHANRTVTLCIDFQELVDLCNLNQYPLDDCMARLKAIGVTQVLLHEETLGSLTATGAVITFPTPDYLRLKILDVMSQGGIAAQNAFITADQKLAESLVRHFKLRYGMNVSLSRSGKYQVITPQWRNAFVPSFWNAEMPVGFSAAKRDYLKAQGFSLALSPQNAGNPQWIAAEDLSGALTFAWETGGIPGYPLRESAFAHYVKQTPLTVAIFEFTQINGMERFTYAVRDRVLIAHTIAPRELGKNTDARFWLARWNRAVTERSNRFLLAHVWPQASVDDNLVSLRLLAQSIRKTGYTTGDARPPDYPVRSSRTIFLAAGLLCAVIFPVLSLVAGRRIDGGIEAYLIMNCITFAGGLAVAAFLSDAVFMQKLSDMPAVKITFFLPLLLSVLVIYPPAEIKRVFSQYLSVRHIIAIGAIVGIAGIIALRSGNTAPEWLQPDKGARQLLENIFAVRPRTKEFLVGQPLLLAGLMMRRRWMILAGMVGQISIINTFMHAHTAVSVSCLRTVHGIWLGLLFGLVLRELIALIERRHMTIFRRSPEHNP